MIAIPRIVTFVLTLQSAVILLAQTPGRFNEDESKVGVYTLPGALACEDGSRVQDVATWQSRRRGEILRSFSALMYGVTPELQTKLQAEVTARRTDAVHGRATRTQITLRFF